MVRPHQEEGTPPQTGRLSLTGGQPDNRERSETVDTTKVDPWGDVTPENLQQWVTHNSDNTCRLVLKALDQRDTYKAQLRDLEEQNNQKDSQIEELSTEKQELEQDVLKLT